MRRILAISLILASSAHARLPASPTFHIRNAGTETQLPTSIEIYCKTPTDATLVRRFTFAPAATTSFAPGETLDIDLPDRTLPNGDYSCQAAVYFGTSRTWTNFTPVLTVNLPPVRSYTITGD